MSREFCRDVAELWGCSKSTPERKCLDGMSFKSSNKGEREPFGNSLSNRTGRINTQYFLVLPFLAFFLEKARKTTQKNKDFLSLPNPKILGKEGKTLKKKEFLAGLVAPYRAILRYYRCDTPYRATLFKGGWHTPKMVRYPPLLLRFTKAHLCDTPFWNISRENCAIPHNNKHERVLRYYRYKSRAIWKVTLLGL